jgi:hypothetical protein
MEHSTLGNEATMFLWNNGKCSPNVTYQATQILNKTTAETSNSAWCMVQAKHEDTFLSSDIKKKCATGSPQFMLGLIPESVAFTETIHKWKSYRLRTL